MPPRETGFLNRTLPPADGRRRYQLYLPPGFDGTEALPVVLFLHGSGERGSDGLLQTEVGLGRALRRDVTRYPAIVVFPQAPAGATWRGAASDLALRALERTLDETGGDPARVLLTGISMGGNGVWHLALEERGRFAAVAPVCGWLDGWRDVRAGGAPRAVDPALMRGFAPIRELPAWVFHGVADPIVPVEASRAPVAALRQLGAQPRYTEYPGIGHNSWDAAYADPEFARWLLSQRRP